MFHGHMKGTNGARFTSKEGGVDKVQLENYIHVGNPRDHRILKAVVERSHKQLEKPAVWLLDRAEVAIDMVVVGHRELTLAAASTLVCVKVVSRHDCHCAGEE